MSYVYIQSEPSLWTVGFYTPNGDWQPESDHTGAEDAAKRVAVLNGTNSSATTQTVVCHSCGVTTHAEHQGPCAMCNQEREWCCECWEAEDTSCRAEYEHDYEEETSGVPA